VHPAEVRDDILQFHSYTVVNEMRVVHEEVHEIRQRLGTVLRQREFQHRHIRLAQRTTADCVMLFLENKYDDDDDSHRIMQ